MSGPSRRTPGGLRSVGVGESKSSMDSERRTLGDSKGMGRAMEMLAAMIHCCFVAKQTHHDARCAVFNIGLPVQGVNQAPLREESNALPTGISI